MRVRLVAAMLLAVALSAPAAADTYRRQPGVRVVRYTFEFTLADTSDSLEVRDTVEVEFLAAGVPSLELDLCNVTATARAPRKPDGSADPCAEPQGGGRANLPAPSGGKGMTITAVTAGGQPLDYRHEDDRVRVTLPRTFRPGDHFEFTLTYHGVPATGMLIGKNRHGDRGFFSNSWPDKARNYRAAIDHPYAKAAVTTVVTAPRHYQVVSNGRLTAEIDLPDGLRRTVWNETTPICTWLMSLGVAPFAVDHFGDYHGIALSSWVYPQEREVSAGAFASHTQRILEYYSDHIGPYAYEKLAQVEANGVSGGMELASSIFYGYAAATGPGRQLIAHEMAHQWFGDAVTENDWDDVWLSEGFATYFALLFQEFADGRDAFLAGVRRSKEQAIRYALANPASTIVHQDLADISKVIANNAQIYQGGAQVLHNIRGVVGTEVFWAGVRGYYERFRNRNATTREFREAMEEACAAAADRCPPDGRDLAWLFSELLNRGGALQVNGNWRYDAAARQVEITLDQTQSSGVYRMPIEVAITEAPAPPGGGRGTVAPQPSSTVHVLSLIEPHQVFRVSCDREPIAVELDPNAWVMMQATFDRRREAPDER